MNRLIFLLSLTFFTINTNSFAQQLDVNQINVIKDTAAAICDTVKEAKGIKTEYQLQGEIQAKLKGLAGKLANIGVEGKGNYGNESFEGLSREATASALEGDRGCRERVFNKMFDKLESSSGLPVLNIVGKWAYDDGAHYWVVRPGPLTGYAIELYTSEDRLVGKGVATVNVNIVNFSLSAENHYAGDTLYMMHGKINGRLEYKDGQLTGQTDEFGIEILEDPASISTLALHRVQ